MHTVLVPDVHGVAAVAAGAAHTCVIQKGAQVEVACWGNGGSGQFGVRPDALADYLSAAPITMPLTALGAASPVNVVVGFFATCILDGQGNVYGTGANTFGELGAITVSQEVDTLQALQGLADGQTVAVATNGSDTCAIRKDGTVVCLGFDDVGQLGRGTITTQSSQPAPVVGLGWTHGDSTPLRDVSGIAMGDDENHSHACAIVRPSCTDPGGVVCWGHNEVGQLGDGTTRSSSSPVRVLAPM
jgi:alpha-tubulin suppressor-like RCC1 family protein